MPYTKGNNKTNKKHRNNKKNEKRKYNFNKKTKDYTKSDPNSIGSKIAKAVTPKTIVDLIPLNKGVKAAKAAYNYMTS